MRERTRLEIRNRARQVGTGLGKPVGGRQEAGERDHLLRRGRGQARMVSRMPAGHALRGGGGRPNPAGRKNRKTEKKKGGAGADGGRDRRCPGPAFFGPLEPPPAQRLSTPTLGSSRVSPDDGGGTEPRLAAGAAGADVNPEGRGRGDTFGDPPAGAFPAEPLWAHRSLKDFRPRLGRRGRGWGGGPYLGRWGLGKGPRLQKVASGPGPAERGSP